MIKKTHPWKWPMITMIVLTSVVLLGTILALLSGCAAKAETTTPVDDQTGYVINEDDMSTFTTLLPSGRRVECVAVTYKGSALQCWEVSE